MLVGSALIRRPETRTDNRSNPTRSNHCPIMEHNQGSDSKSGMYVWTQVKDAELHTSERVLKIMNNLTSLFTSFIFLALFVLRTFVHDRKLRQ